MTTAPSATRTALVTGAAVGLGRTIADRLARAGDRVALLDVDAGRLAQAEEELCGEGHDVVAVTCDVRDRDAVEAAVAQVVDRWGGLDVAVSNAGVAGARLLLDMDAEEWHRVVDINLTGTFHVITAAARAMIATGGGGAICCISSGAALFARPAAGHYCTSKAGVLMLAKALALETGRDGVRVNVVTPGLVDHGYREGLGEFVPAAYAQMMRDNTPMGRLGTADEVADAVQFLCSAQAEFVTGAVLSVDGGSSAGKYTVPWG
ncbi:MAG: SDR family oxidoreductase [Nocardioidaceae bacterium]|nr:SDR family oxidoreductase [Nocardioidaceae bacterium]